MTPRTPRTGWTGSTGSNRRAGPARLEDHSDVRLAVGVFALGLGAVAFDLAHAMASFFDGRGFRWLSLRQAAVVAGHALFARGKADRVVASGGATGGVGWLAIVLLVGVVAAVGCWAGAARLLRGHRLRGHRRRARSSTGEPRSAEWGDQRELRALRVGKRRSGRLVVGRLGRSLIATESSHSLLVIGPTQSGKTSGLVIPALLEWEGPVIATSVKRDLLDATLGRRRSLGPVAVFDPSGTSGEEATRWDPLATTRSWAGAKRMAANLCGVARSQPGGLDDGAFWYGTAEKLLAPLLFAAATSGRTIDDVLRWVDLRTTEEPLAVLAGTGEQGPWQAALASFDREERQLSSVYATAEHVLAAFGDPGAGPGGGGPVFDLPGFFGPRSSTLYLVSSARAQDRLAPLFVAFVGELLESAFSRGASPVPDDRRLLLVLDEAANIAPVRDLDVVASTAAGHGIQLVTVFQDMAQVDSRYGAKAATIVNNHRARLICSGIADSKTLIEVSSLVGDAEFVATSRSSGEGGTTISWSSERRPLASPDTLRRIEPGDGVLLYGHLPPVRLRLRPWFASRQLRRLSSAGPSLSAE